MLSAARWMWRSRSTHANSPGGYTRDPAFGGGGVEFDYFDVHTPGALYKGFKKVINRDFLPWFRGAEGKYVISADVNLYFEFGRFILK